MTSRDMITFWNFLLLTKVHQKFFDFFVLFDLFCWLYLLLQWSATPSSAVPVVHWTWTNTFHYSHWNFSEKPIFKNSRQVHLQRRLTKFFTIFSKVKVDKKWHLQLLMAFRQFWLFFTAVSGNRYLNVYSKCAIRHIFYFTPHILFNISSNVGKIFFLIFSHFVNFQHFYMRWQSNEIS